MIKSLIFFLVNSPLYHEMFVNKEYVSFIGKNETNVYDLMSLGAS
jgi:hypothetical protein